MFNRKVNKFSKEDIVMAAMYGEVSVIDAHHITSTLEVMSISLDKEPSFCFGCIYAENLKVINELPIKYYCTIRIKQSKCKGKYKEEWD